MPELPEVETIRRGLVPVLQGHVFTNVVISDSRLTRPARSQPIADDLAGRRVVALKRLGKYLLFVLDNDMVIEHHLRMTGSFGVYAPGAPITHQHVRMTYMIEDGTLVVYNDPRRFGTLVYEPRDVAMARLAVKLGVEPLSEDFTAARLARLLARSRAPIKAALLNQGIVAGLGNIYVDEALFVAGVHPLTPSNAVSRARVTKLRDAIVSKLEEAIDVGGSTLRDYRNVAGEAGGMQERFVAYGRGGLPCLKCGRAMCSARVAGRGTTWCDHCQRQLRPQ